MSVNRNKKSGRFESSNPDPMTKAMIEKRQNSRGMRVLRALMAIDQKNGQQERSD